MNPYTPPTDPETPKPKPVENQAGRLVAIVFAGLILGGTFLMAALSVLRESVLPLQSHTLGREVMLLPISIAVSTGFRSRGFAMTMIGLASSGSVGLGIMVSGLRRQRSRQE
ncbi:hypothetical protein Mal15_16890 [Stieleria maiorica]|uniref:Uncharacterized protein n=1 Tax=Stieleria maiorica TaxID=2795974 RepID=A0A5B9M976_9BACT|nr:hypothetical protein Mal15_16890 [Stieleria maiorica]